MSKLIVIIECARTYQEEAMADSRRRGEIPLVFDTYGLEHAEMRVVRNLLEDTIATHNEGFSTDSDTYSFPIVAFYTGGGISTEMLATARRLTGTECEIRGEIPPTPAPAPAYKPTHKFPIGARIVHLHFGPGVVTGHGGVSFCDAEYTLLLDSDAGKAKPLFPPTTIFLECYMVAE